MVTGAGRGIGQELALALARAGAAVAVLDRDAPGASETAAAITQAGGQALAIVCDVTDEKSVAAAFAEVAGAFGRLDVLVNNAGLALRKPTAELPLADWEKVVAVNMTGVFLCCREAARMMAPRRTGSIVNIASIMGLSGGGLYPNISYQATKGAVVNMTRALAVELGPSNVRVNAIAPTWVRTAFIRPLLDDAALVRRMEAMMPLGRLAETADLVGAVLFLAGAGSAMVTGHTLPVDGGFLAQ
jgi:NAD(P)-dependent dehydrogenase (short-subunit alcohol dehydrogenase family)